MIHASVVVVSALLYLVPGPRGAAPCLPGLSPTGQGIATPGAASRPGADLRSLRVGVPDDELRDLYDSGAPYLNFLEEARSRAALWHDNTEDAAEIDPALVERARAVGGTWHFLAVAVDSCSDSVSTIPYLAALVEAVDGVSLRIVDPVAGRSVMEGHPTPDGRGATPTVLLLDDDFDEAGCFIERPPALQRWIAVRPDLSGQEIYAGKMAWYADDGGEDTVRAFVEMLEAAAEGRTICR